MVKPRRLLRFSLRTLLLLTAVVACWLGVQVNKAQKHKAAVAAIEAAGGRVSYGQYHGWRAVAAEYLGRNALQDNYIIYVPVKSIDGTLTRHIENLPNSMFCFDDGDEFTRFHTKFPQHPAVGTF